MSACVCLPHTCEHLASGEHANAMNRHQSHDKNSQTIDLLNWIYKQVVKISLVNGGSACMCVFSVNSSHVLGWWKGWGSMENQRETHAGAFRAMTAGASNQMVPPLWNLRHQENKSQCDWELSHWYLTMNGHFFPQYCLHVIWTQYIRQNCLCILAVGFLEWIKNSTIAPFQSQKTELAEPTAKPAEMQ